MTIQLADGLDVSGHGAIIAGGMDRTFAADRGGRGGSPH